MFQRTIIPIAVLALASLCTTGMTQETAISQEQSRKPEQEAQQAAETWLNVVDSGEYDTSWEQASSFFKSRVSEEQWAQSLSAGRQALGTVVKRSLKVAQFTETLPNMPSGEYVIIQFGADFEQKEGATETVTLLKEDDGAWKVAGYFIS